MTIIVNKNLEKKDVDTKNIILLKKKNIIEEIFKLLKAFKNSGEFYLFGSALHDFKSANDLDIIFVPSKSIKISNWSSKKVYIQYDEYRRKDNKPKENYVDLIVDSSGKFYKKISEKVRLDEWLAGRTV